MIMNLLMTDIQWLLLPYLSNTFSFLQILIGIPTIFTITFFETNKGHFVVEVRGLWDILL